MKLFIMEKQAANRGVDCFVVDLSNSKAMVAQVSSSNFEGFDTLTEDAKHQRILSICNSTECTKNTDISSKCLNKACDVVVASHDKNISDQGTVIYSVDDKVFPVYACSEKYSIKPFNKRLNTYMELLLLRVNTN